MEDLTEQQQQRLNKLNELRTIGIDPYPARIEDCNLSAIRTLKQEFNCQVGWSDHTVSPEIIHRAVYQWGAEIIEFHLDLEGSGREFSGDSYNGFER